jgi:2'-hydroxyisoflavone reductase
MTSRRDFLRITVAAGAAAGAGLTPLSGAHARRPAGAPADAARAESRRSLRVLLLGGTGFIGPHLVRTLLERGHTPTLFNRGRTTPRLFAELFPGLENLVGDRDGDISALAGGRWDAVIDDSGYTPQQVSATARLLVGSVGQYLFTSTRGVYAEFTRLPMDEDSPVGMAGVPASDWTGYGPLKALSEREVVRAFPGATTIVRPPIITGPGDTTDRFTYWYVRVDRGGDILAPGDPTDPVQYIDVRDLADFYVRLVEQRTFGTFNLTAPAAPLSSGAFLNGIRATTGAPVSFTWIGWDFLEQHVLRGGQELAAWRPPRGENLHYGRVDNRRALAAGATFRPLADTARDTRDWWYAEHGRTAQLRSGPAPAREADVLSAWRAARGRTGPA